MEDTPRLSLRRKIAIGALLFAGFMVYRVFFVYTVRTGGCSLHGQPLSMTDGETRVDGRGRTVVYPRRTGGERAARPLVVMTYNIEGHAALWRSDHVAEIARTIAAHHPDIVGLEEVHRFTWQSKFRDQAELLGRETGMRVVFAPSFHNGRGEFGNAILTRGTILSSEKFDLPSIGEPRSAMRALIEIDGNRLNVFVAHLTAWGRFHSGSRMDQTRCLTEIISRSRLPFLLVGDFNTNPEAPEIRLLLDNPRLQFAGVVDEPTHSLMNERIDYIFADQGWQVQAAQVLHEGQSDHWPVIARLAWSRPRTEER